MEGQNKQSSPIPTASRVFKCLLKPMGLVLVDRQLNAQNKQNQSQGCSGRSTKDQGFQKDNQPVLRESNQRMVPTEPGFVLLTSLKDF